MRAEGEGNTADSVVGSGTVLEDSHLDGSPVEYVAARVGYVRDAGRCGARASGFDGRHCVCVSGYRGWVWLLG